MSISSETPRDGNQPMKTGNPLKIDIECHKALDLAQSWPLPSNPRPIVVIGTGGIVNDTHLPAYSKSGLPLAG